MFWKIELIVWAQLWAIVYLTIIDWNLCFVRNAFHICMHILHSIHHMHTMLIYIPLICVLECTHCGRKGHLTKFYFGRLNSLNFANKNVWVPNITNPRGSKRIWVPKFLPLIIDVGVGSHKKWENWCLDGGCIWSLKDKSIWCIAIMEAWWEDHLVLKKWIGYINISNYFILHF